MARGARRLNRGKINSELRQRIAERVRDGDFCLRSLGAAAGFPDPPAFSRQLNSDDGVPYFSANTREMEARC